MGLQRLHVVGERTADGVQEVVVVWQHEDGTRCALFDTGDRFELRIVREHAIVRQQPVTQVLHALYVLAPAWEVEQTAVQSD
jgi:hypothetical protein